jgi:hypothetical protein
MIGATLQGIGLDAHRLGFPRDGYQAVGHALLRTVRGAFPADWSGQLSSSWIGYHSWLCEYWVSGADIGAYEDQTQPRGLPTYQGPVGGPDPGPDHDLVEEKNSSGWRTMTRSLSRTSRKR